MNNIETITDRILSDARAEAAQILGAAQERADQIHREGQRRAEAEYDGLLASGRSEAAALLKRRVGADAMVGRSELLARKQALIAQVFDRAREELLGYDEARRVSLLAQLAVNGTRTGTEEIILSSVDRSTIGEGVVRAANLLLAGMDRKAELTLSDLSRPMEGGLYLKDGRVETNCSYDAILRRLRQTISAEVAELLFS